jgi:hypothetical protein
MKKKMFLMWIKIMFYYGKLFVLSVCAGFTIYCEIYYLINKNWYMVKLFNIEQIKKINVKLVYVEKCIGAKTEPCGTAAVA